MRRRSWCALSLAAVGLAGDAVGDAGPPPRPRWTYRVAVAPDLNSLTVRLDFERFTPRRVWLADGGRPAHLRVLAEDGLALTPDPSTPGAFLVGGGPAGGIAYRVDLAALVAAGGAWPVGRDLLAHAGALLLRPALRPPDLEATIRFECPADVGVATPWRRVGEGPTYDVPPTSWDFIGHVAFGRPRTRRFEAAGAAVDLVLLEGALAVGPEALERWVSTAVVADASPYGGRFPAPRLTVFVAPSARAREPVPFGSAWYGGGPHVVLHVSARASEADLRADWTAVHEVFHATMPPIAREDAWFSEGVTTYYQEVLRARAGLQSPAQAWNELESGWRRGRRDGGGLPLAQESRSMYANHSFHRVYWAGAALAFLLDVELRRAGGGGRSLDDAMRWIRELPGATERPLAAREAVAAIDARAGEPVFARLAERWLARRDFPDVAPAQAWLGLEPDGEGRVALVAAPGSEVRDAIMAGTAPGR